MAEKEMLEKMKGRIVKDVQFQEISGDIYHLIISFHDGYTIEIDNSSENCLMCDQSIFSWMEVNEIKGGKE